MIVVALAAPVFVGPVEALTLGLAGIVIISAMHEVGHLMPAGHSGAKVEQFAIGMLRRLCALTTDNTQHAVNAAPVGGFVALPTDDEHPLKAQCPGPGYGRTLAIVLAGSVANTSCVPVLIGAAPAVQREHLTGPSAPPSIGAQVPGLGSRRPRLAVRRDGWWEPHGSTRKGAAIE